MISVQITILQMFNVAQILALLSEPALLFSILGLLIQISVESLHPDKELISQENAKLARTNELSTISMFLAIKLLLYVETIKTASVNNIAVVQDALRILIVLMIGSFASMEYAKTDAMC